MVSTITSTFHCISDCFTALVYIPCHDSSKIRERDAVKRMMCAEQGITLLVIPYWWNKMPQSIAHVIHVTRPDIVVPNSLLTGDSIPQFSESQCLVNVHYKV